MRTLLTSAFILLLSFIAAAQSGKLTITVHSETNWEPALVTLSRNDSVVRNSMTNESGVCVFSFLEGGKYNVKVTKAGSITSELKDIMVNDESVIAVTVTLNSIDDTPVSDDPGPYAAVVLSGSIHPALDTYDVSDRFVSSYRYGFGNTFYSHNANFVHLAFTQQLNMGGHRLRNAMRVNPYGVEGSEKYFFFNYALAVSARLNLIRGNNPGNPKLFFETGAGYNIPIMYRHVAHDGIRTIYTKNMNKFNEFFGFARIGSQWLSVKAHYALTDFIKAGYSEPPRVTVGIELLLGAGVE